MNSSQFPVSDVDLVKMTGNDASVLDFSELPQYTKEELFRQHPMVILFFAEAEKNGDSYGHWVSIERVGGNRYVYFDPEGGPPADLFRYVDKAFLRKRYGGRKDQLQQVLGRGAELIYNDVPLQTHGTSTCGRWQILRAITRRTTPFPQFVQTMLHFIESTPRGSIDHLLDEMIRVSGHGHIAFEEYFRS